MFSLSKKTLGFALILSALASSNANATIIDFTGGTAYLYDGGTAVTNSTNTYQGVDYYEENGFRLDFITIDQFPFTSEVGNYYNAGNDVIHGHWLTGRFGGLTEIRVSKVDGSSFDLNYFIMTSNTDVGGAPASGNEQAYIHASNDGVNVSFSQLLPSDDWGFGGVNPQVILGSAFDSIKYFSFTVDNAVDCFGMDNFYIDEPAPVPEPAPIVLLGLAFIALGLRRRLARK